jgi:hypothetical protein
MKEMKKGKLKGKLKGNECMCYSGSNKRFEPLFTHPNKP